MKKRLISLLLAFSMMLTFLPAGAVSAFADESIDLSSKGELLKDGATITDSGTYQLRGPYTQGITINTDGPVEINVTGNVTVDFPENNNNYYFITIKKAGSVTFNGDAQYPVIVNGGNVISNEGGNLTVNRGKYICNGRNRYFFAFDFSNGINQVENVTIESKYGAIRATLNCKNAVIDSSIITAKWAYDGAIRCWPREYSSIMELDNVDAEAEEEGDALRVETGTVTVNKGNYKSGQGCAIRTWNNTDTNLNLTIIGGTYQNGNYDRVVADFGCHGHPRDPRECNIHIHGSTFVGGPLLRFYGDYAKTLTIDEDTTFQSTGGTDDAVAVGGHGQLIFNSGTIEVSGDSARAALRTYDKGEAIVNDGTFKGAKCDIYERNDDYRVPPYRVQLNHANFDDKVCNVYLEKDLQIDVAQNYTGEVTIECEDPKDGRQLTKATETNYQKDLNLTSANAGYLVGYKKTADGEYRCLSKKVGVTISDLKGEIKAEESAEFTVTLTHENSPGTGILTFGDKNDEIEYKDEHGAYQRMPDGGLPIKLASNKNDYAFRITPKNAGEQTLTAAVVRDAVEVGTDSKDYTVAGRVHTTVAIEGLEDAVIKEGESKDFTVKVDPKDDAKLGEAFIDFGNKNSEIEYKDKNGEYKPMPDNGLKINLGDGEVEREFRITPKETGKQTLTAAVKQDKNELARDEKDFVVSEMPILTLKDGVITSVTVPGKDGADPEDITEIVKKNANEDGSFNVPEGATVSVAFDKDAFADSGLKFGHWEITGLDDPNAYQDKESFDFVMPAKGVTLRAMTQDASIEDDGPGVLGTVAIIGTAAVGTAVLGYQAYSLGAEFAGKLLNLPYFPSNRSALAMMLWEDAGKPMPESELLYPDVGQEERDMDLQHAARWAMENDLIPDLNDEGTAPEEMKFYPDNAVSKIDVLKAWQKAQELKQNA